MVYDAYADDSDAGNGDVALVAEKSGRASIYDPDRHKLDAKSLGGGCGASERLKDCSDVGRGARPEGYD